MRITLFAALTILCGTLGCHSPYVAATIVNKTSEPIALIEVDYPSASFGTQNLAPGAEFHYRFKILGDGGTKLIYTDNAHKDHTYNGPSLKEGAEGQLRIVIDPAGVAWQADPTVTASR